MKPRLAAALWAARLFVLPFASEAAIAQATPVSTQPAALQRTADGHPDLQGVWEFRWRTLLTRPPGVVAPTLDPAAAKALLARQATIIASLPGNGNPPDESDYTTLLPAGPNFRTSLIVDPANGQIPWLPGRAPPAINPEAIVSDPEERGLSERCIQNSGFPIIPYPTNSYVQIVQPPGEIVMMPEPLSELRRLAPGARTQPSPDVQSHWEGDSLVVETRNYAPDLRFTAPVTLVAFSRATTTRETFTPVSADEIAYRFTITDPTLYASPWTAETTWIRSKHNLLEYACHEGNYALANILKGGRAQERRLAEKTKR